MEQLVDTPDLTYDEGKVIAINEREDGWMITIHEPEAEFEMGFAVSFADYDFDEPDPIVGDNIEIRGHGSPFGINFLAVNGRVIFDRTPQQQRIVHEIRKREFEIQKLWEAYQNLNQPDAS